MLNRSGHQIAWGHVANEALHHPIKSGLSSMGIGTASVGVGLAAQDYFLVASGAGLTGLGAMRFHDFACNLG